MLFSSLKRINRLITKLRKVTFSKLRFSWKENVKKCTSFEEQKGTRYIRRNVYFGIIFFSCLSSTIPCLRFLLICFVREIKHFYQSSLGNEVDERTMITMTLWSLLAPFSVRKIIFNTNSELLQNPAEKQFMSFKATVNWLFNDIWCYLAIGCFDWKIGLFQQTVLRVYYIQKKSWSVSS